MTKTKKKEPETIFGKCSDLNERLSSYMKGIEGLRVKIYETIPVNKAEQELISYLNEHFNTILADLLIMKDVLYEVELCDSDYSELSFLLELKNDSENIN